MMGHLDMDQTLHYFAVISGYYNDENDQILGNICKFISVKVIE